MTMTRYEPWKALNEFHNDINRLFDHRISGMHHDDTQVATSDWVPAVDVKEETNQYLIYVDVPGVEAKDIEITMEKGVLSIKGDRKSVKEAERGGFKRVERSHGTFYRSFSLPDTADVKNISAKGKNGVLEITIPKQERVQPRKISVES